MGFPIPGDAIEQSLDLNRYLVHNHASTFFMRVDGDAIVGAAVQPGDLLVIDRSLEAHHNVLVLGVIDGEMKVLQVESAGQNLTPKLTTAHPPFDSFVIWGVITYVIRKV